MPHAQLYRVPVRFTEQGLLREAAEDLYRTLQDEIDPDDSIRAESRSRILELAAEHEQAYVDFWAEPARDPHRTPKK
ncbi:hypothetical protein [Nocardia sp. BMG51109]|uniref:hypothetical protein n=1 Tax=Nocardia sp. BMG51109 TaxID=1056816 RepID=UPI000466A15E|nr:hypothetical protein [Nocardia sp. BMG51109]